MSRALGLHLHIIHKSVRDSSREFTSVGEELKHGSPPSKSMAFEAKNTIFSNFLIPPKTSHRPAVNEDLRKGIVPA